MRRAIFAALAAFVLIAQAAPLIAQDYLLQAGDRIQVSVLEDPALNQPVLVRPDGRISLPLAGTLTAAGRTPEALQAAIRQRLSRDFVEPPTVTVSLISVAAPDPELALEAEGLASIYVLGEVRSPGVYEVQAPIDILQLLALSGGVDVFAARDRIQVRRQSESGETVFVFDYDSVESGATPYGRIALRDGDVVVVPESGLFD